VRIMNEVFEHTEVGHPLERGKIDSIDDHGSQEIDIVV
jgi:hypothetical protein